MRQNVIPSKSHGPVQMAARQSWSAGMGLGWKEKDKVSMKYYRSSSFVAKRAALERTYHNSFLPPQWLCFGVFPSPCPSPKYMIFCWLISIYKRWHQVHIFITKSNYDHLSWLSFGCLALLMIHSRSRHRSVMDVELVVQAKGPKVSHQGGQQPTGTLVEKYF